MLRARLLTTACMLAVLLAPRTAAAAGTTVPLSLQRGSGLPGVASITPVELPATDGTALRAADAAALRAAQSAGRGREKNLRVGDPLQVDIRPATAGRWDDLPGGDRVWRVRVRSEGALWIVLGFGTFRPAPGAELRVFDPAGTRALGPYTAADEADHGQLWTPPIAGGEVVVELLWPRALAGVMPNIHLGTVARGYRPVFGIGGTWSDAGSGAGTDAGAGPDAGACEIDVMCPLGANWQSDKHGVVNLLSGGSGYCSGSLIANADTACKNYVLTAHHCLSSQGSAASTVFQFNYERPACKSGTPPSDQQVSGSNLRATSSPSDFTLLEISAPIPPAYAPYFNGWTRSTTPASPEAWGLHHPNNDEKKISRSPNPLTNGSSWGPNHWRVRWWDDGREGVTEPGSSGSPLFDPQHRIVGQLHGGDSSCSAPPSGMWDEYGKVDVSWTGGGTAASRLSDWLDPSGTGAIAQDGYDAADCGSGNAPKLAYEATTIEDPPGGGGNGNGALEPGETATLVVAVRNKGAKGATSVAGTLTSTAPGVTLLDANAAYPDIAAGGVQATVVPHFLVRLAPGVACGAALPFTLVNTAAEEPGSWTSPFTLYVGQPVTTVAFQDDVEGGPGAWVSQSLAGANTWTITDQASFSPAHSWAVGENRTLTDTVLRMAPLANLGPNARLTFQQRFSTENNYDGGVLEYSTDGTTWQDAKPLFLEGGYNSSIVAATTSPLAGRDCWAGDSAGWKKVAVDLSSLAGLTVRLRWRFATNQQFAVGLGWAIDDVAVSSETYTCPAVRPGEARDLMIVRSAGGYTLDWAAPLTGGAPLRSVLYRNPLGGTAYGAATCEADLGSGTTAVLPSLSANGGFVAVARNAAGDGSYGRSSAGDERAPAAPGDTCP